MSPKQKMIAAKAPPPNKIDEKDFAVLRAEKAKGRGMGLQDESKKPGKIYKAKKGSGLDLPVISSVKPTVNKTKRAQNLARMREQFNKQKSRMGKNPNKTLDSPKAGDKFLKRRKELGAAGKVISATKVGKIVLPIVGAGVAAQQYLKSKMKNKDKKMGGGMMKRAEGGPAEKSETHKMFMKYGKKVPKKMGGGMMQRPMGYKGGGMDTGKVGEMKSKLSVLRNKFKRDGMRLTDRDIETANKILKGGRGKALRGTQEMISRLKKFDPDKKMGGGMMQRPMGYKSGKSIKVKCKLGKNKPTKMY